MPVDHFEHLHIQDTFHSNQHPPSSPPSVIVFNREAYPISCTALTGHTSPSLDQLNSPDDHHEFFSLGESHPTDNGSATRIRRWSSGGDDMGIRRRSLSNTSSPPSIRNSPCVSRSLEPESPFPSQSLGTRSPQDYQAHFPLTSPSIGVDTVVNSSNPPFGNSIPHPSAWRRKVQNGILLDAPGQSQYIPPMTHHFPQDPSRVAEMYNPQYTPAPASASYRTMCGAPLDHVPQSMAYGQPPAPAQTAGPTFPSHDLPHRFNPTIASPSLPLRMTKPMVTSLAVRNASNNRIRHPPKHACPHCPELFTTSGNLRSTPASRPSSPWTGILTAPCCIQITRIPISASNLIAASTLAAAGNS